MSGRSADGYCRRRDDRQHCVHWDDGEKCCACGAPAMTVKQRREQGMLPARVETKRKERR